MILTLSIVLIVVQTKLYGVYTEKITETMIEDLAKSLSDLLPIVKSWKPTVQENGIDDSSSLKETMKWKGEIKQKSNSDSNGNVEMINIINPNKDETITFEKKTIVLNKYPGSKLKLFHMMNSFNDVYKKPYSHYSRKHPYYYYSVPKGYSGAKKYRYQSMKNKLPKTTDVSDEQHNLKDDDVTRDVSDTKNDINEKLSNSMEKLSWEKNFDLKKNISDNLSDEKKENNDISWIPEKIESTVDSTTKEDDNGFVELIKALFSNHQLMNSTVAANETLSQVYSNQTNSNITLPTSTSSPILITA